MKSLCPDAWLLNYTNPMSTLCRAINKTTRIKTVGLCHELLLVLRTLKEIFKVEKDSDIQLVKNWEDAAKMLDELLQANADYLPQFRL